MVIVMLAFAVILTAAAMLGTGAANAQSTAPTEIAPATPDLPRNQELILGWSITSPIGVTNPWAVPGYTHQEGNVLMWEPLMYYAIFADKYIPWLATSMEYTKHGFHRARDQAQSEGGLERRPAGDGEGRGLHLRRADEEREAALSRLVRPIRRLGESRGRPDGGRALQDSGAAVQVRGADLEIRHRHPDRARARARQTDRRQLLSPAATEIPHSGPYDLVAWNATQKIYNLRPDWWAVKAGLIAEPAVKRM